MEKGHWYTDKNGNHYFVEDGQSPKEGWEQSKRRKMIDGGKYKVDDGDGKGPREVSREEYDKYEADDDFDATTDDDFGFDEDNDTDKYSEPAYGEEEGHDYELDALREREERGLDNDIEDPKEGSGDPDDDFTKTKSQMADYIDKAGKAHQAMDKRSFKGTSGIPAGIKRSLMKDFGMNQEEADQAVDAYWNSPGWVKEAVKSDTYAQNELKDWFGKRKGAAKENPAKALKDWLGNTVDDEGNKIIDRISDEEDFSKPITFHMDFENRSKKEALEKLNEKLSPYGVTASTSDPRSDQGWGEIVIQADGKKNPEGSGQKVPIGPNGAPSKEWFEKTFEEELSDEDYMEIADAFRKVHNRKKGK